MQSAIAELTADVVVIGAGPAGAVTALMLAPSCRTLLLDRADLQAAPAADRIGESLPAAARRLLSDMGLWEDFHGQGHLPCHTRRSLWGDPDPSVADSLRDADGAGWLLDRARFDAWLRDCARGRGAALVSPAKPVAVTRIEDGWRLTLERRNRPITVAARWLVDAGGRPAPLTRMLGIKRNRGDQLICRWITGLCALPGAGLSVAAEPEGWWYTAALPGSRRILAFHTDADLPVARVATHDTAPFLARAGEQAGLAPVLDGFAIAPAARLGVCAAHSAWVEQTSGRGWIAVGDAALACDPLSAQGLFNALYTGFLGAGAIRESLAGNSGALEEYQRAVDTMAGAYRRGLQAWYGLETRWLDKPFWARRVLPPSA